MQVVTIHIETPKGSFVKRDEHGSAEFISPLPAPFNYGHVVGQMGGDGDPLDAVLLGAALKSGENQGYVVGVVRFVDCNQPDDKWICCPQPRISRPQRQMVQYFFQLYAVAKQLWAWMRIRGCQCRVLRIEWF